MGVPLQNTRWEAYCQARVFGRMTSVSAYRAAGYLGNAIKQAERVASEKPVKDRMRELMQERSDKNLGKELYDRQVVIEELLENLRESKKGYHHFKGKTVYLTEPDGTVVLDESQQPIPMMRRDPKAINEALELLGSELGMFPKINKLEHVHGDPFKGLTVEEIMVEARNSMMSELGWEIKLDDLFKLIGHARGERKAADVRRDRTLPERTGSE